MIEGASATILCLLSLQMSPAQQKKACECGRRNGSIPFHRSSVHLVYHMGTCITCKHLDVPAKIVLHSCGNCVFKYNGKFDFQGYTSLFRNLDLLVWVFHSASDPQYIVHVAVSQWLNLEIQCVAVFVSFDIFAGVSNDWCIIPFE